jgi:hypothetical protein
MHILYFPTRIICFIIIKMYIIVAKKIQECIFILSKLQITF